MSHRLLVADALDGLTRLPDESVQCVVTSPPYWGLRDYGVDGMIGLEPTFEEYLERLLAVFREVRRVLRRDGTLWLNLGDAYTAGGRSSRGADRKSQARAMACRPSTPAGLKPKDLLGLPWRLAFALQADGWWLRSDIIWHKPNPMPSSVTDRPTVVHEYVFLLTRSARYYYDAEAVREPATGLNGHDLTGPGYAAPGQTPQTGNRGAWHGSSFTSAQDGATKRRLGHGQRVERASRNLRDVWTIATEPFAEAHFATFPTALVKPCVLAGTSERGACSHCGAPWTRVVEVTGAPAGRERNRGGRTDGYSAPAQWPGDKDPATRRTVGWRPTCRCGRAETVACVVLDPFAGAGTTGLVSVRYGRDFVGIELNPEYAAMAERRIGAASAQRLLPLEDAGPELEPRAPQLCLFEDAG